MGEGGRKRGYSLIEEVSEGKGEEGGGEIAYALVEIVAKR